MPTHTRNADTAIVVLHEIYGRNLHMGDVCEEYCALDYHVISPDMLGGDRVFSYASRDQAYRHFIENVGFEAAAAAVGRVVADLSQRYARVFLVGFSVGATVAWLAAATSPCAGIVCHYGSRIRDYLTGKPPCPALLLMAESDASFPSDMARQYFTEMRGVELHVLKGEHGFCDRHGAAHHPESAARAKELAHAFIRHTPPADGVCLT